MTTLGIILSCVLGTLLIVYEIVMLLYIDYIFAPSKRKEDAIFNLLVVEKEEIIRKYLFKRDSYINFNNEKIHKLAKLLVKNDLDKINENEEFLMLKLLSNLNICLASLTANEFVYKQKKCSTLKSKAKNVETFFTTPRKTKGGK